MLVHPGVDEGFMGELAVMPHRVHPAPAIALGVWLGTRRHRIVQPADVGVRDGFGQRDQYGPGDGAVTGVVARHGGDLMLAAESFGGVPSDLIWRHPNLRPVILAVDAELHTGDTHVVARV